MTLHTFKELANIDIKIIDKANIIDIKDLSIVTNTDKTDAIKAFLATADQPDLIKCGEILVKSTFVTTSVKLDECMERYFIKRLNNRL